MRHGIVFVVSLFFQNIILHLVTWSSLAWFGKKIVVRLVKLINNGEISKFQLMVRDHREGTRRSFIYLFILLCGTKFCIYVIIPLAKHLDVPTKMSVSITVPNSNRSTVMSAIWCHFSEIRRSNMFNFHCTKIA